MRKQTPHCYVLHISTLIPPNMEAPLFGLITFVFLIIIELPGSFNWYMFLFITFFKKKTKSMNGLLSFNLLQGWMVRNQVYLFSYRIDIFNKNFPHQYSWNKIGLCALRLSTAYTISHFISKGRKFINIVIRVIVYIIDTGNDSSLYMHIFEYFHMCMNRGVTYVQVEERDIEWEGEHRERHRERKKWAG